MNKCFLFHCEVAGKYVKQFLYELKHLNVVFKLSHAVRLPFHMKHLKLTSLYKTQIYFFLNKEEINDFKSNSICSSQ